MVKPGKIILYTALVISIFFAVFILLNSAYSNFHEFKGQQNYIKEINNNSSAEIQSWMTPQSIITHFNISQQVLLNELNITYSKTNLRTPISKICKNKKLNCTTVIEKLNQIK